MKLRSLSWLLLSLLLLVPEGSATKTPAQRPNKIARRQDKRNLYQLGYGLGAEPHPVYGPPEVPVHHPAPPPTPPPLEPEHPLLFPQQVDVPVAAPVLPPPLPLPLPVQVLTRHVPVPVYKPYPVHVEKLVHVPYPVDRYIRVDRPYPVPVAVRVHYEPLPRDWK